MWSYQQSSGKLFDAAGALAGTGYSGAPEGKNDPAKQSAHAVGPIPRGVYTMGAPEDTAEHGPFVLPLTPDTANEMFGRSGFLMHGDSMAKPGRASKGCIIMPRTVRNAVWASGDARLEVVE